MLKGFKVRLFPTKEQEEKLWKSVGTARWVWNWGVAFNQELYAKEKRFALEYELKKEFTKIRNSEEFFWLKEVSRKVGDIALLDLGTAFRHFFKKHKKGEKGGFPKFKSRARTKPSFGLDAFTVMFYEEGVQLLKIGHVKFRSNHDILTLMDAKLYNTRVSYSNHKWILSFSAEVQKPLPPVLNDFSVGIDLGIKTLAVVSCQGKFYKAKNINKSHKAKRLEKQLKHLQRAFSRKKEGSNNRKKALWKMQDKYSKIANIRRDNLHKVTTKIVEMLPKRIVIEDLAVQNMMKNKHLAKAISQMEWGTFRTILECKAKERGIEIQVADPFFPSSKTCSNCGNVKEKLSLNERVYKCPVCGLVMDRDENAARNLEKAV
jgi:putative transposase